MRHHLPTNVTHCASAGGRYGRRMAGRDRQRPAGRHRVSQRNAEAARIERALRMLDRLDIARHMLHLEPVNSRTALALQLLEQTADDIAELAGMP